MVKINEMYLTRIAISAGIINIVASFLIKLLSQQLPPDSPLIDNPISHMLLLHHNQMLFTTLLIMLIGVLAVILETFIPVM